MRDLLRMAFCITCSWLMLGCQSTPQKGKGIAESCYQPLYWPSEACPPGKK